jgi:hypothetical protein
MNGGEDAQLIELAVTPAFAASHGWVVQGITGFLSAYYMEDPRFRVLRRSHDPVTGLYVWQCRMDSGMTLARLVKRLRQDIPPCRTIEETPLGRPARVLLDVPDDAS